MSVIFPKEDFDAEQSARALEEAMDGAGTDEDKVIEVLTEHTNEQRRAIAVVYQTMYGRSLEDRIKGDFSSDLEDTLRGLLEPPRVYDAKQLRKAMKGAGTDEGVLMEILCARTPEEIDEIKFIYKREFDRELIEDIQNETSRKLERLLVSQATGGRDRSDDIDLDKAADDARKLFEAGEAQWGTDESEFMIILCLRNFRQLKVIFEAYERITGKDIEDSIKGEFSGDLEEGLLILARYAKDPALMYARRLYRAMKGAGTDEETLARILVSRSEVDMMQIRAVFFALYDQTLKAFIEDDVSGDFKRVLLRLIGRDDE